MKPKTLFLILAVAGAVIPLLELVLLVLVELVGDQKADAEAESGPSTSY